MKEDKKFDVGRKFSDSFGLEYIHAKGVMSSHLERQTPFGMKAFSQLEEKGKLPKLANVRESGEQLVVRNALDAVERK